MLSSKFSITFQNSLIISKNIQCVIGGVEVTSVLVVLVLASCCGNTIFPISHKNPDSLKHMLAAFLFVVDVFL